MTADKIKVELAPIGEYPPGEEWRAKIREAIDMLGRVPDEDQWVKVQGIELSIVNNARSAAHARVKSWTDDWNPTKWQLITRYDRDTETLWMTAQRSEDEEE